MNGNGTKIPDNRRRLPEAVYTAVGIDGAEQLLAGGSVVLRQGGYLVLDLSRRSVGGYSCFTVRSFRGAPTLRLSYFDRAEDFSDPSVRGCGDFKRGSCTYLGIEVPVLPANPQRYEAYEIVRTGEYLYPLIQGQQRFVCFEVSGEGAEAELSDYYIYHTEDVCAYEGSFRSDSDQLNRLWASSAYTVQLATIYSDLFECVEGKLLLRPMTRAKPFGLYREPIGSEFVLACEAELYRAPNGAAAVGIAFGCSDRENGRVIRIDGDGTVALEEIAAGKARVIEERKGAPIGVNAVFRLELRCRGGEVTVAVGDRTETFSAPFCAGYWGFCQENEAVAVLRNCSVRLDGDRRVIPDFRDFCFERTGAFLSDGAKRDRLPWTGDLFWAFDAGWYPFGRGMKAYNTLKILSRFQTPEGFIFGTWYPEDENRPQAGYGCYESDMFSAWFVIAALYYYQLSGDPRTEEFYPAMARCISYLERQIDPRDHLFNQRYETSKGLWDHALGDTGKNTYTNLILCDCYRSLASFARSIGKDGDADHYEAKEKILHEAIDRYLYDDSLGGFVKRKDWRVLCDMANPYAIGRGLASKAQAAAIARHVAETCKKYGKVMIMMIRGLYDYGYPEQAYEALSARTPLIERGEVYSYVDWFGSLEERGLPETVYECMHNPPHDFGAHYNWGDLSHPDSGISGLISGRIAGILPEEPGFRSVLVRPNPGKLSAVDCVVPTAYGPIGYRYQKTADGAYIQMKVPAGISVTESFGHLPGAIRCEIEYEQNQEEERKK